MTDEQLAEIEARLNAATPGPWVHYYNKLRPQFPTWIREIQTRNGRSVVQWGGFDGNHHAKKNNANAEFIAHAPTDIAALLAEVKRLRSELNHVDAVLARRTALDGLPNRVAKILHAINTAAKIDPLEARIRRLEAK